MSAGFDIDEADENGRLRGMRRWVRVRRLRRAARLLSQGRISLVDYGAIALGTVAELRGIKPEGSVFHLLAFSVTASLTLGVPIESARFKELGPLSKATFALIEALPGNLDTGDMHDAQAMTFRWGTRATRLYRRGLFRLSLGGRALERLDRWSADQTEFAPHASALVRASVAWVVTTVLAFMLGRLTAP